MSSTTLSSATAGFAAVSSTHPVAGYAVDVGEAFVDVTPSAGRLIIFRSADVEHQVLPMRHSDSDARATDRWAITFWLYGQITQRKVVLPVPSASASGQSETSRATRPIADSRISSLIDSFIGDDASRSLPRELLALHLANGPRQTIRGQRALLAPNQPQSRVPKSFRSGEGTIFVSIPAYRDVEVRRSFNDN